MVQSEIYEATPERIEAIKWPHPGNFPDDKEYRDALQQVVAWLTERNGEAVTSGSGLKIKTDSLGYVPIYGGDYVAYWSGGAIERISALEFHRRWRKELTPGSVMKVVNDVLKEVLTGSQGDEPSDEAEEANVWHRCCEHCNGAQGHAPHTQGCPPKADPFSDPSTSSLQDEISAAIYLLVRNGYMVSYTPRDEPLPQDMGLGSLMAIPERDQQFACVYCYADRTPNSSTIVLADAMYIANGWGVCALHVDKAIHDEGE